MPLSPDEYLQKLEEESLDIDPDAYLAEMALKSTPSKIEFSGPESFAAGALQGVTMNSADEIHGAIGGLYDSTLGGRGLHTLKDRYKVNRDEAREYYNEADRQNPKSSMAGQVIGGGITAFMPALSVAKYGKYGAAALTGGLAGLGASDKEGYLGNLEDSAKGAAGGVGLTYGLTKVIPKKIGDLEKPIREYANEKAVAATGAMTKEMRELGFKGQMQNQGDFLLRNKIVTPLSSLKNVAERSAAIKARAGDIIGGTVDSIDKLRNDAIKLVKDSISRSTSRTPQDLQKYLGLKKAINDEFGYGFARVADKIDEIIARDRGIVAADPHIPHLQALADGFRQRGAEGFRDLRTGLRNKTEHRRLMKTVDTLGEEYKQEVYDLISAELERSVGNYERLAAGVQKMYGSEMGKKIGGEAAELAAQKALPPGNAIGIPQAQLPKQGVNRLQGEAKTKLDEFRQANRDYAGAAVAEATAERRLGTTRANRDYGLTTMGAAMMGGSLAGPVGGAVLGGVNNFFRTYGSALQATGAYKIADMLKQNPNAFGNYSSTLAEALRRGPRQFLMANYLISKKDPQYVTFLDQLMRGNEQ